MEMRVSLDAGNTELECPRGVQVIYTGAGTDQDLSLILTANPDGLTIAVSTPDTGIIGQTTYTVDAMLAMFPR